MKKLTRVQLDLPVAKLEELKKLMQETGVQTQREFINNALTLLEWAINERKKGHIIASIDGEDKTYRELHMPILFNIATSSSTSTKTNVHAVVANDND